MNERHFLCLQPFAPGATAAEGAVLGALQIRYVAVRTVVSALVAWGVLNLLSQAGWGLGGVWVGLICISAVNLFCDAAKLLVSKSSPLLEPSA